MSIALRRHPRGYITLDGQFFVEHDVASIGEWDELGDQDWFVYRADQGDDVGLPDAVFDAPTLRECREWIEAQP